MVLDIKPYKFKKTKELGVDYIQGYYHGEPREAKFYNII